MPDDFSLRPATEADLPAIAAIYSDAVLNGVASYELEAPSLDDMRNRWRNVVSRGFPYLVGMVSGDVVGFAYAGPYHTRAGYRFSVEDSIYIAPAAQGRGIGRALLTQVIASCERDGYRQMIAVIGSGTENPGSVRLHEKLGFTRIGVIEGSGFKHGGWRDTVLMQRALGPGRTTLPEG